MKRGNNPLVLCLFGILPVVWLGLLIAPAAHGGQRGHARQNPGGQPLVSRGQIVEKCRE